MFFKIDGLKNFTNFTGKVADPKDSNNTNFKNTFLYRTPPVAASEVRIFENANERLPLEKLTSFIFSYWPISGVYNFLK